MKVIKETIERTVYYSIDNNRFTSKKECEKQDKLVLSKMRCFKVSLFPTDGYGGLMLFFAVYDGGGFELHYIEEILQKYRSNSPLFADLQGIFNISQIQTSEYMSVYSESMFLRASNGGGLSNLRFFLLSREQLNGFPKPTQYVKQN